MSSLGPRDVSRQTGVSTDTLRHYERLGLLRDTCRTSAGHRRYSSAAVVRVVTIQRALAVGFSLKDIGRILDERDKGGAPCRKVRALVVERLQGLSARIDELLQLKTDLERLVADWDARLDGLPAGQRAHLLDTLGSRPSIERERATKLSRPTPPRSRR